MTTVTHISDEQKQIERIRHNQQREDWRPQFDSTPAGVMIENLVFPDGTRGVVYRVGGRFQPSSSPNTFRTITEAARDERAAALREWAATGERS